MVIFFLSLEHMKNYSILNATIYSLILGHWFDGIFLSLAVSENKKQQNYFTIEKFLFNPCNSQKSSKFSNGNQLLLIIDLYWHDIKYECLDELGCWPLHSIEMPFNRNKSSSCPIWTFNEFWIHQLDNLPHMDEIHFSYLIFQTRNWVILRHFQIVV